MKPEPQKNVGGRPRKGKHKLEARIFTRVATADNEWLEEQARRYKVLISDVVRWILEDAVASGWTPSHLAPKE